MKKIIIFLLILFSFSITPLTTKTPVTAATPKYNWNYWGYEFGFGVGYLHYTLPKKNAPLEQKVFQYPLPDFRLGIEKSWRFANNFTATVDFACLTPAATVGYLVSPTTRLYIGTQYSLFLNFGSLSSSVVNEKTVSLSPDGTTETTKTAQQSIYTGTKGPLLGLTPRIGIDHFISSSTMLRFNLSYDWRTFYNQDTKQPIPGNLHWPQLTIGLKKFF